jgi:hypothetical protein
MAFQNRLRAGVRLVYDIPRISIEKVDRQFFKNLVNNKLINELFLIFKLLSHYFNSERIV